MRRVSMCRLLSTEEEDSKTCKKIQNYHIIDGRQDNVSSQQSSRLRGYYLQKVPHYCSHHVTVHTTTSNLVQYSPTKYTLRH